MVPDQLRGQEDLGRADGDVVLVREIRKQEHQTFAIQRGLERVHVGVVVEDISTYGASSNTSIAAPTNWRNGLRFSPTTERSHFELSKK